MYFRQMADLRGWVGDTPGFNGDLGVILGSTKAKTRFFANPNDQWVSKQYYESMAGSIPGAKISWIESVAGHLMCCNADPNATQALDAAIRAFFQELVQAWEATK